MTMRTRPIVIAKINFVFAPNCITVRQTNPVWPEQPARTLIEKQPVKKLQTIAYYYRPSSDTPANGISSWSFIFSLSVFKTKRKHAYTQILQTYVCQKTVPVEVCSCMSDVFSHTFSGQHCLQVVDLFALR